MPRVCVVGAGAIGGLFAAHLARLDALEVWVYDVSADVIAAIARDGLRVTGAIEIVSHPHATSDAREIPECAYGIVATKSAFTEPALRASAAAFAGAAVCSVQNGLGNEETIARFVPRVIRGATIPAARVIAPGVIGLDAGGPTWIGPFEPRPAAMDEVRWLAERLTTAGLPTQALADARGAQWAKVLFNASSNALGALTGLTQGRLCGHPPTRRLISVLLDEGRAVAQASGIAIDVDLEQMVDESAISGVDHRSSTLQDVMARRPTEVDALNGAIARLGRECGVPTPLHESVAALISGLEQSWI